MNDALSTGPFDEVSGSLQQLLLFFMFEFFLCRNAKGLSVCLPVLLAVLGLRCCTQAFSSCGERGLLCCGAGALGTWASVAVALGLGCSEACGMLLDQGADPCSLHY